MGNYQYSIHIDGQEFLIIFLSQFMKEFVRSSTIYHILHTQAYVHINLIHSTLLFWFFWFFRFFVSLFIHDPQTLIHTYTRAFIISDLPTICTCHNNLRLTYRIVKDFSSKIFFAIIYTAFSAVNQ